MNKIPKNIPQYLTRAMLRIRIESCVLLVLACSQFSAILDDAFRYSGQFTPPSHVGQPVQDYFMASQGMSGQRCSVIQCVSKNAAKAREGLWQRT
jgi:hypothetical protein